MLIDRLLTCAALYRESCAALYRESCAALCGEHGPQRYLVGIKNGRCVSRWHRGSFRSVWGGR